MDKRIKLNKLNAFVTKKLYEFVQFLNVSVKLAFLTFVKVDAPV